MPDPGSASPARSAASLAETVDFLGIVVAQMSKKLDDQGALQSRSVDALVAGLKATLDAAVAAKKQTDPERYGAYIGNQLDIAFERPLARLEAMQAAFAADRQETASRLAELAVQEETMLERLRTDLEKVQGWKRRIPFIALFGLVLALGFGIALPRFMAGNATTCAVLGGEWLPPPGSEKEACVFYAG